MEGRGSTTEAPDVEDDRGLDLVVTCGKCKLSRLIDFLTRLATFCGIAFIGDTDGEVELDDDGDSERAFALLATVVAIDIMGDDVVVDAEVERE